MSRVQELVLLASSVNAERQAVAAQAKHPHKPIQPLGLVIHCHVQNVMLYGTAPVCCFRSLVFKLLTGTNLSCLFSASLLWPKPTKVSLLLAVGFNRGFLDGGGEGGMPQPRRRGLPALPSQDNDAALQAIGV